jgi:hypothetical protein
LIEEFQTSLLPIAGGATTFPGVGVWVNGDGRPLKERITVVETYLPRRLSSPMKWALVEVFSELASRAGREALVIAVNGRMFLIRGSS